MASAETDMPPSGADSNHGKGIALTTGFVGVLALISIICTALPLAVSTSKNEDKVPKASGYAWAAFTFEIISVVLIGLAMFLYYQCVKGNPTLQAIWDKRYEDRTEDMSTAAAGISAGASVGASRVHKQLFGSADIDTDISIGSPRNPRIIADPALAPGGIHQGGTTYEPSSSSVPLPLVQTSPASLRGPAPLPPSPPVSSVLPVSSVPPPPPFNLTSSNPLPTKSWE